MPASRPASTPAEPRTTATGYGFRFWGISALARRTKHVSSGGWVGSVFRATVLPFLAVLILASVTGWYAHKHCPTATRLREAVFCATTR